MRLLVIAVCLTLGGCAGTMNGMVRSSGHPVSIAYNQSTDHDDLKVTMPDGETFTGKAVMVGKSTSLGYSFGSATASSSKGHYAAGSRSAFGVVNTYTGNMQAVLFGNRGHTMRCNFQYADASGFTADGGIGLCETSDGRVIDVQW